MSRFTSPKPPTWAEYTGTLRRSLTLTPEEETLTMSFEIKINDDGTIRYVSHFEPGRGSLPALGASGLVDYLNDIPDHAALLAVAIGVGSAPFGVVTFPESAGAQGLARQFLTIAREDRKEQVEAYAAAGDLGQWRKVLCVRYCGGMNAPGDLWIRCIAYACRAEARPTALEVGERIHTELQLALDLGDEPTVGDHWTEREDLDGDAADLYEGGES